MTLIAFGSAKGSPGVTTAVVALAAVWPAAAVLADCDPAGGDLALRLTDPAGQPLWRDRGLVAFASLAQRGITRPDGRDVGGGGLDLGGFLQTARGGLSVLVGLESAAQSAAISGAWPLIGRQLRALSTQRPVLADCGRLSVDPADLVEVADPAGSAGTAGQLWRQADLLVLCTHPRPDALVHLLHTVHAIGAGRARSADATINGPGLVPPIVVVVMEDGSTPDAVEQVRRAVQIHGVSDGTGRPADLAVLGGLAHDPAGAAGLAGTPTRRLDRCPLIRSARLLAPLLAERAHASVNRPAVAGQSTSADHEHLAWPVRNLLPSLAGTDITDVATAQISSAVRTPDGVLR